MELVTERNGGAKNLHGQGEGAQPEASILIVECLNLYMNTVMNEYTIVGQRRHCLQVERAFIVLSQNIKTLN